MWDGSVGSTITLILLPSVGGMWRGGRWGEAHGSNRRHLQDLDHKGLEILLRNLIFI